MMLNDERDLLERDVEAVLIERDERHVIVGNIFSQDSNTEVTGSATNRNEPRT